MTTQRVKPDSAAVHRVAEERIPSWGILEAFAYFQKVENGTTAHSKTCDGKHIQITFLPRPPPLLSRFCIHSPDGADMYREPLIVATEDDLALIRVDTYYTLRVGYYVYGSGKPSLTLLPETPNGLHFYPKDIGLIRRPGKGYIVVGFRFSADVYSEEGLTLCVYDSKLQHWKVHALSLSPQGVQEYGDKIFLHKNCKVVTVGGDAGRMAFLDLWRGVIFCDVLTLEREAARQVKCEAIPLLDYVSMPDDLTRTAKVKGDARLYRDIAFLNNHLKCVDLASRSLWIRPATTTGAWSQQYMIRTFKEIDDNNLCILLPGHKTVYRSFKGLLVCRPVVGLQDDGDAHMLYFTVKTHDTDVKGSVLAVDMETKKIQDVAPFVLRDTPSIQF